MRNILKGIHPRGTAKLTARDSGVPMRTMERILDGTSVPSFETVLRLFAAYPELLEMFEPVTSWAGVARAAVVEAVAEAAFEEQRVKAQALRGRAAARMRGL